MELITIESQAFSKLLENIENLTKTIRRSSLVKPVKKQATTVKEEVWLSTEEACAFLKVTGRTLQTYRDELIIPYTQIQRKVYFKKSDLIAILEKNYVKLDK